MALLGVLPRRNPLTDWHKTWHGWLVWDTTQYPKWHVDRLRGVTPTKGWNVNGLCFFYLFFSAARGQTAGSILTSNISKRVFLKILHFFVGYSNYITISGGQNPQKQLKIGPSRHFPAKMPKSYNGNISNTISPIKLKFEAQLGTTRY